MSNNGTNKIRTGSYAVTTVYSMPWVKKKTTTKRAPRKKATKKVVHEIFSRCADIVTDPYWVSIFTDCSYDKFPRGFSFKNGLLTHRKGNKINRTLVPNSPAEAISASLSFFKSAAGLMSKADRKRMQEEDEKRLADQTNIKDMKWSDISLATVKELLINEFISDVAKSDNFDTEQKNDLATTVKMGFMLKYFKNKDVEMEDGKIKSIKGLIYDREVNEYSIDPTIKTKIPGRKYQGLGIEKRPAKPHVPFIDIWEKYLNNLTKEQQNISNNNFRIIESKSSDSHSGELYSTGNSRTPSDSI
jgi:hypothetical protein